MAHLHPLFYYRGSAPEAFYYRGLGHSVFTPAFSLAAAVIIAALAITTLIAVRAFRHTTTPGR